MPDEKIIEPVTTNLPKARKQSDLEILIRARYPLIYVVSWEEQRVIKEVKQIASRATTETMPALCVREHKKRSRFLVMKRAQTLKVFPGRGKLYHAPHNYLNL